MPSRPNPGSSFPVLAFSANNLFFGPNPAFAGPAAGRSRSQRRFNRRLHAGLTAGGDPTPVVEVAVLFLPRALDGDLAGRALAIARNHDERVGARGLRVQLELHVGLGGQQEELRGAEVHGGHVNGLAGGGALAPREVHGGEALGEGFLIGSKQLR